MKIQFFYIQIFSEIMEYITGKEKQLNKKTRNGQEYNRNSREYEE